MTHGRSKRKWCCSGAGQEEMAYPVGRLVLRRCTNDFTLGLQVESAKERNELCIKGT